MAIQVVLFDLDNTIYPASNGLMGTIDRRIGEFLERSLGLTPEESLRLRRQYYAEFGTTLRGLQHHHTHLEVESYLQYVHDLALDAFLVSDERLGAVLEALPARKAIFTNSPREHAERVLRTLGIAQHFEHIFDLRFFDFTCKPDPSCYARVLQELGVDGRETALIEDTAPNLGPARQLGMATILIADPVCAHELADYVVSDVVAAVEVARRLIASRHPSRRKAGPVRIGEDRRP